MKKNESKKSDLKEEIFDVAVIGGGVVGAAILNKAARIGKKCILLDKASDVCTGASKANSGIVHAGYDPKPDSLKAQMNVRGNKLFPVLAKRLGVPLNKCGALVVGDDEEAVDKLLLRAKQNGVAAEKLNRQQIDEKVQGLSGNISVALYAPNSYVVSPYYFTISLVDEAILCGAKVFLEQDLTSCKRKEKYFEIKTKTDVFYARAIVNSAGAGYNDVAKILGSEQKDLQFRRGEYFVFEQGALSIPLTVFPLPTAEGKGVLVTPTIDGNHLVGPTSQLTQSTSKVTTADGLSQIKQKSWLVFDGLNFRHAIREFSGIRVICGDDFVIERSKKVDGVVNLAGICSPGLTSSPAIAERVCQLLGWNLTEKENLPKLPKFTLFKNMTVQEQKKAIAQNPAYGQVVCKCEKITRGDIQAALSRPLACKSVDGVKRRTNAGMGRCQGGFCFTKVVKEIAAARGILYENVLKENRGSEVAKGERDLTSL